MERLRALTGRKLIRGLPSHLLRGLPRNKTEGVKGIDGVRPEKKKAKSPLEKKGRVIENKEI